MTLVWRGVDLQPIHGRWRFWIDDGRDDLPEFRAYSDLVPFRVGRVPREPFADTRAIGLRGLVREGTIPELLGTLEYVKGLFSPQVGPGVLVDDRDPSAVRVIRAIPANILSAIGNEVVRLMSIELTAFDPYWYGTWGTLVLDDGLTLDGGYGLDSSSAIVVSASASSTPVTIDTLGTADVRRVVVRFTGPSAGGPGLEVTHADGTVVGFVLAAPLASGEELVVDNEARSVLVGATSRRASMTLGEGNRYGEYVRLAAGVNSVRIRGAPTETRIQFSPTYL